MNHFVSRALGLAVLGLLFTTSMFAGSVDLVITQSSFATYGPGNEPIGPYQGTLNGNPNLFSCLDEFKTTDIGVMYPGTLGLATTVEEKEAVWLTDQEIDLLAMGKTPYTDLSQFGDLNFAVWHIIDPLNVDLSTLPGAQADVTAAQNFLAANPNWVPNHEIFTPDDQNSQSFAVVGSTVPEPGTLALLGSGMLGLGGILRRKLRA